jgi:clan AA aspartic protease (TIGR02281 family)
MQEKYDESLDLMYQLQNSYLESELSQKVNNSLPKMVSGYLNILYDKQDMENLDNIVNKFISHNDFDSLTKWQETILKIAQDDNSKQYYEKAMELLAKLKNYSLSDETNMKYQNLYDVLINNYLKEIESTENQEKLQKLIDDLLENKKPQIKRAESLLSKLKRKEEIKNIAGKRISLEKNNNQYFINASINGLPSTLLLDTGATTTMINYSFMQQTSFKLLQENLRLSTASGEERADLVMVDSFKIDDISLSSFEIIVSKNDVFENFDGLLGMNFLNNFHFQIDTHNNQLILN